MTMGRVLLSFLVALAVGLAVATVILNSAYDGGWPSGLLERYQRATDYRGGLALAFVAAAVSSGPALLAALLALTGFLWSRMPDRETRCRQCRYVLRSLATPQCPECGTAI